MWTITLRDLQYRGRQFGIAVAGAALVFAMALELTGISAGFRTEARDVVNGMGADAWIVERGSTGPFTSQGALTESVVGAVARARGIDEAHPLVEFGHVAHRHGGTERQVNVIGHDIGRLGDPLYGRRAPERRGEAVVDERLDVNVGDTDA